MILRFYESKLTERKKTNIKEFIFFCILFKSQGTKGINSYICLILAYANVKY